MHVSTSGFSSQQSFEWRRHRQPKKAKAGAGANPADTSDIELVDEHGGNTADAPDIGDQINMMHSAMEGQCTGVVLLVRHDEASRVRSAF